eukprot:351719-Chlamydomonas_euryale.AAC.3
MHAGVGTLPSPPHKFSRRAHAGPLPHKHTSWCECAPPLPHFSSIRTLVSMSPPLPLPTHQLNTHAGVHVPPAPIPHISSI